MNNRSDLFPPPSWVLAAFAADGAATLLVGGRGLAWRAGSIVVKPADTSEEGLSWQAGTLSAIREDGFRLSLPRRSLHGTFVVDGWSASTFCTGSHEPRRWLDIIRVGERLHAALASCRFPEFVRRRIDPWAIADRAAWGDVPLAPYLEAPHAARLANLLKPVQAPSQIIHSDLTCNVLFADGLPPAVIDLSAYWRPAGYASAIVVADALACEGASPSDLGPATSVGGFGQLLLRALLFRIVTDWLVDSAASTAGASAYSAAVDLAVHLVRQDR
ncbi:MAG TPA: TIGR02569 family protein [Candidatus Limnocylindrales bacterium]